MISKASIKAQVEEEKKKISRRIQRIQSLLQSWKEELEGAEVDETATAA